MILYIHISPFFEENEKKKKWGKLQNSCININICLYKQRKHIYQKILFPLGESDLEGWGDIL